jgi:hypothetical protein
MPTRARSGEGIVDALSIPYAGRTAYEGDLWPHNSILVMGFGNVRTHDYMLTSMGRNPPDHRHVLSRERTHAVPIPRPLRLLSSGQA